MRTSIVFVALICVAAAFGQTGEQLQKQFGELKQTVARQTFEKAAYAEEHERDFEKASRLYVETIAAADSVGDKELADQARRAFRLVAARMGKGTETNPAGQDVPIAVQRRLFLLIKQLSSPKEGEHQMEQKNYEAMNQLTPFGAVAVPMLERALNSEMIEDPDAVPVLTAEDEQQIREMRKVYSDDWPKLRALLDKATLAAGKPTQTAGGFRGNTHWAARTLAMIDAPEAVAALTRGLKSPDPFVRTNVVENAWAPRHRALLDEAAKDPTLAGVAIRRLSYAKDPNLFDLMKSAVARDDQGGPAAMQWLMRNRREEGIAAAKNPKILGETLKEGLDEIVGEPTNNGVRGNQPRTVVEIEAKLPVLLEIGEAHEDASRVLIVLEQVNRLLGSSSQFDAALKARLEAIALRALPDAIKENSSQAIMRLLGNIGGLPTARTLIGSGKGPVEETSFNSIQRILYRVPSSQFLEAFDVAKSVADRAERGQVRSLLMQLFQQLRTPAQGASVEDLLAAFKKLDAEVRHVYFDEILLKLDKTPLDLVLGLLGADDWVSRKRALDMLEKNLAGADQRALVAAVSALSDPSEGVRQAAINALNNLQNRAGLSVYKRPEVLAEQVKAHASEPSFQLASALDRLDPKDAMPLLDVLWNASSKNHGLVLAVMLEIDSDAANAFLVKHFDEIDDGRKGQAIERFGKAVYEPAIEVIGAQLASRDENIRSRAQQALAIFKTQREAVEEFNRWKTGSAESRASIIELTKLLESPNRDVVIGAVRALGAVKAQSALPALVKLLERNDPALKAAVDEAIRKIGE